MKNNEWTTLHSRYSKQDWINKPNIFAQEVIKYFPKHSKILELCAGQGQDSRFFAQNGFTVVSTDISDIALEASKAKIEEEYKSRLTIQKLDIQEKFPFADASFDVVYAHLGIHYFNSKTTQKIFAEIHRILKPNRIIAILTNSINDPQYDTGEKLEEDFYFIEDKKKRFFSIESMKSFVKDFQIILLDDKGETYKDSEKGVHNLIRFVGSRR